MVTVDGPVGVGVGLEADVQPTSAPAAKTSRARVRYMGTRRSCAARCRTAPNIPSIERRTVASSHRVVVDHGPLPPILGTEREDPPLPPLVGTALMVTTVVAAPPAVPFAMVDGLGVQVAPVSVVGKAQVMVTSAGSVAPEGVRFRFMVSRYGVPATTGAGFGVPVPAVRLDMPTRGSVCVVAAGPPPRLVDGFLGFVTVTTKLPASAATSSAAGTLMTSEVPSALAVPFNCVLRGAVVPSVTNVEAFNPVPVIVICCADVAPAIKPKFGEIADCVGTMLSTFAGESVAVLSVLLPSLGSATVAMFVTLGKAPGATEALSVNVLLPPGARAAPVYVQMTMGGVCVPATQAQLAPVLETYPTPTGKLSVTVMLPVVGPEPLLVTLILNVLFEPTTKSPAGWVSDKVTSGAVTPVGISMAVLSFVPESPASATVAELVTVGNAAEATETVSVSVLLAPAAIGPAFVQVTA